MNRYPLIAILIPLILFILVVDRVYHFDGPDYPKERTSYLVEIVGSPVKRHKTWRMPAAVLAYRLPKSASSAASFIGQYAHSKRDKAMIYLMVDSGVPVPARADRLWLDTRMVSIADTTSSLPAYYRKYLYHNDYSCTAIVYGQRWSKVAPHFLPHLHATSSFYRRIAAHFEHQRHRLIHYYHSVLPLQSKDTTSYVCFPSISVSDRFSLLESLSIGQRQHLSEKVKTDFSASGISHLLALSGFHLMVLLFPFFLWNKIDRRFGSRIVQTGLIILVMAYFTLLSGAPVSLCRASLLLASCYILSLFSTQVSSLNNLFLVAIIMLLIHPFWLFDVGFQLSFVAVLSIQLFLPLLRISLAGKNARTAPLPLWKQRAIKYVWDPVSVALAAQIGTFPLVVYHFNQFALYAIGASVVMIPIITLVLYLAWGMPLLHLVLSPLDPFLAPLISALLGAMLFVAQTVNKLPNASLHFQQLSWLELVLNYGLVFLIYRLLKTKKVLFYGLLLGMLIFILLILSRF